MTKIKSNIYQTKKSLEITIDNIKCISCGICTTIAPNTFEMDGLEMVSKVKENSEDNLNTINQAAFACPGKAISVKDKATQT